MDDEQKSKRCFYARNIIPLLLKFPKEDWDWHTLSYKLPMSFIISTTEMELTRKDLKLKKTPTLILPWRISGIAGNRTMKWHHIEGFVEVLSKIHLYCLKKNNDWKKITGAEKSQLTENGRKLVAKNINKKIIGMDLKITEVLCEQEWHFLEDPNYTIKNLASTMAMYCQNIVNIYINHTEMVKRSRLFDQYGKNKKKTTIITDNPYLTPETVENSLFLDWDILGLILKWFENEIKISENLAFEFLNRIQGEEQKYLIAITNFKNKESVLKFYEECNLGEKKKMFARYLESKSIPLVLEIWNDAGSKYSNQFLLNKTSYGTFKLLLEKGMINLDKYKSRFNFGSPILLENFPNEFIEETFGLRSENKIEWPIIYVAMQMKNSQTILNTFMSIDEKKLPHLRSKEMAISSCLQNGWDLYFLLPYIKKLNLNVINFSNVVSEKNNITMETYMEQKQLNPNQKLFDLRFTGPQFTLEKIATYGDCKTINMIISFPWFYENSDMDTKYVLEFEKLFTKKQLFGRGRRPYLRDIVYSDFEQSFIRHNRISYINIILKICDKLNIFLPNETIFNILYFLMLDKRLAPRI